MIALERLINDYCIKHKKGEDNDLDAYVKAYNENGFDYLLQRAIVGVTPEVKRDSHKYRVAKAAMRKLYEELSKLDENVFKSCQTFEDILKIIYDNKPKGFNSLSVYDTACKIAVCYGLYPQKIYLHAGAKKGAINLLGMLEYKRQLKLFHNDREYPCLLLDDFPEEIQTLEMYHIENFLCIYKDRLFSLKK